MNRQKITTLMICRAGIIAALYVALTMPFGPLAFGPFQIRPAEALTLLPLFYPEAIPGLYVGCMLSNLLSNYGVYDVLLGSLATLLAAGCTYCVGRLIKNNIVRMIVGGIFPVILNAFFVPAVWLLAGSEIAYWYEFAVMLLNEGVWVYAAGIPLYFAIATLIKKQVKGLMPYGELRKKKKTENDPEKPKPVENVDNLG